MQRTSVEDQPPVYERVYAAFFSKDYGVPQDEASEALFGEFSGLLSRIRSDNLEDLFEWTHDEESDHVHTKIGYDPEHYVEMTLMLSNKGSHNGYRARLTANSVKRGRRSHSRRLIVTGKGKKKSAVKKINLDLMNALCLVDVSGG